jgi:hypothetical protein
VAGKSQYPAPRASLIDAMGMLMNGGKGATLMRAEFDRLQMWVGSARRALRLDSSHRCAIDTPHTNLWSVSLYAIWQWMMYPLIGSSRYLAGMQIQSTRTATEMLRCRNPILLPIPTGSAYAGRGGDGECVCLAT